MKPILNFSQISKERLIKILDDIELTDDEQQKIKKDIYIASNFRFEDKDKLTLYTYIYKLRYKLKCPIPDMSIFFHMSRQNMQLKLKKIGWEYTKSESALIANSKRDYKQIRLKSRFTLLENNKVHFGSSVEEYIRQKFNIVLTKILKNYEVIVGVNNLSILDDGMEADIPIIILGANSIFKYVIEPGAPCWHNAEDDMRKESFLNKKGYTTFRIITKDNNFNKIDKEINKITSIIFQDICK